MQKPATKLTGRALIASVDILSLVQSYGVSLTKDKGEHVGLCPFHADNNPSFYVNTKKQPCAVFTCQPCGIGGTALDFVIYAERARGNIYGDAKREKNEAFKILETGVAGGTLPAASYSNDKATGNEWVVLTPVPADAPPPVFTHYKRGLAAATWAYRDANKNVLYYTARFELADGGKDVLPLSYCEKDGRRFWRWQGQPTPRPLYGLDKLAAAKPTIPVLLVEGEKTADAANKLANGAFVALTWAGGARGIRFADWGPLQGRNVITWQDADTPGGEAMYGYYHTKTNEWRDGVAQFALQAGAKNVKAVVPVDVPEGWDIADAEGWKSSDLLDYLRAHIQAVPEVPKPAALAVAEPAPAPAEMPTLASVLAELAEDEDEDTRPFRALGYRKNANGQGEFYFYAYKARQALKFVPSNFTKSGLLQLADADYWKLKFPGKDGYETPAAEYLMNECYAADVYDPETVRGIGAWLDEGRVVVHAGTHLVESGKEYRLQDFDSRFLYEANRPFGFKIVEPIADAEAAKFIDVLQLLTWERPAYAFLFLGWCIIAPVSGALMWRPHIWLTGPAGSGKTTAMKLLHELVGNIALRVQGNTTEAAIRQLLNQDARPVCFDEADSDGAGDNSRLQTILSLVRAASSADGGGIAKGGSNGTAQTFLIRSCFAFASITPKVANAADRSRVSVLSLVKPPEMIKTAAEQKWQAIEAQLHECFSPERCEQMQARTLRLLPQLLQNSKIFARAAALVLGEQRAGDQLGVLLAGAYSALHTDVITFEEAKSWIETANWDEIRNEEKDEQMLLSKIMEQQIRIRTTSGAEHERTVGELVMLASEGASGDEVVDSSSAAKRLGRIGIRVEGPLLFISNTADWVTKVLRGTAWATNHGKVLARIPGAEAVKQKYFGPGCKTRGVQIPIAILKG